MFVLPNLTPKRKKVKRVVLEDDSDVSGYDSWAEDDLDARRQERNSDLGSDDEESNDYYAGTGE